MEFGIITALLVVTIYVLLVIVLWKARVLEKLGVSAAGPLLMIRTKRGLRLIERLSGREHFWRRFGNVSLGILVFFMILVTVVLIWEVPLALRVPASAAPGPEMILGIPGINPLIPIGYGILALAIGIVVHEFAHGVLSRTAGVPVKSTGLLLFVVPIGAFVEPDEEALKKLPRRKRARMYAVNPASNLILEFACDGIVSWGFRASTGPVEEGVVVTHVVKDYPAHSAGIPPWALITSIQLPNESAEQAVIRDEEGFSALMARSHSGDNATITYLFRGERRTVHVLLADKYEYYKKYYNESNREEYRGRGFLGIGTMSADLLPTTLARPLKPDSLERFVASAAYYISLPLFRLMPIESPVTDLYEVRGPLSVFPPQAFWLLANTFYWLFWINLMIGLTNCLPIPRLDGGMVYKDALERAMELLRPLWEARRREALATRIYIATGLFVIFLIMWQFVGPRVGALL
ncbi:MAG: site-2 protease family protein [Thermoplasmata archaeon]